MAIGTRSHILFMNPLSWNDSFWASSTQNRACFKNVCIPVCFRICSNLTLAGLGVHFCNLAFRCGRKKVPFVKSPAHGHRPVPRISMLPARVCGVQSAGGKKFPFCMLSACRAATLRLGARGGGEMRYRSNYAQGAFFRQHWNASSGEKKFPCAKFV